MTRQPLVLRLFVILVGSLAAIELGTSPALACGGDGERACCVGEGAPCQPGLSEINGCDSACSCGVFSAVSHCHRPTACGSEGQRACCAGQGEGVPCADGLVEVSGCDGDCICGGAANPTAIASSGHCVRPTHCGGDGERACCVGVSEYAAGTGSVCEDGKIPILGCAENCQCGGNAAGGTNSQDTCVTATHCGGANERACCLSERFILACDDGLREIEGCTGDCFCKGGRAISTCVQLDGNGKLPLIAQPGTNRTAPPAAPRSCPLAGYADLHVHMFSDTGHGGGVFGGAAWDPLNDDVNVALGPDYGTNRDLVKKTGGELPTPNQCPSYIRDCGTKLFHGDHVIPFDDTVGFGTGDLSEGPLGAPNFNDWPTWHTTTHQQVYYKWLERAYQGGLRLISMLAVTNKALCLGNKHYRNVNCADSMAAIDQQLADAVDFERFIDNHSGGPGQGWFRIVRTPAEARQAIADGKLAVVLGIEVDNLFNCHWQDRDATTGTCSAAGIAERVNHYYDLGVRHVFPVHNFNNAFGGPATWQDAIDVGNRASEGHWWTTPMIPQILDCYDDGYRFKLSADMQYFISLLGMGHVIPESDPIPTYPGTRATCNSLGLTPRGINLVNALMNKGMLIDVDHMSVLAIDDTLALARQRSPEYPLLATHVQFFDLNQSSQRHERMRTREQLQAIRNGGGMIAAMLKDDGQDSLLGQSGKVNAAYTTSPSGVSIPDDCRHSSKMFAQMYQYAVDVMGGPVALGSDFNGVAGHIGPRFGPDACGSNMSEWAHEYRTGNRLAYPFDLASIGEPGFGTFGKQVTGGKTFDYNVDGLAHIGLLPDMVADLARVGLPQSYIDALFGSAEQYVRVWERAASIAAGSGTSGGIAHCEDRTVDADSTCHASASVASEADQGNPALTLTQQPAGPYALGVTTVTLHASSDQSCATDSCTANVTVRDVTGPTMTCPSVAPLECTGVNTSVSFGRTTAVDNCGAVTSDGCSRAPTSGFPVGNTTVTCASHDAAQNTGQCSFPVQVTDTTPPTISCPAPVSVECQGNRRATATFPGAGAQDTCSAATSSCTPLSGSSFALGRNPVSCNALDGSGNTAGCTFEVSVVDTTPPTIRCPEPSTLECTGSNRALATVTAAGSDICWGTLAPRCSPAGTDYAYSLGTTAITCSEQDGSQLAAQCQTSVRVVDTRRPSVSAATSMDVMNLPTGPNHNMLNVGYVSSSVDTCNGPLAVTVKVYANEDDEMPTGDGQFSPDALDIGPNRTLRLRHERVGSGNGRVYLIVSTATDSSGNVGAACSTVVVPANQSQASIRATADSVRAACIVGNGTVPSNYYLVGDGRVIGTKQ